MNMTHDGAVRHTGPPFRSRGGDHRRHVERIGGHQDFATNVLPRASWAVGIHLDTQAVRVPKV